MRFSVVQRVISCKKETGCRVAKWDKEGGEGGEEASCKSKSTQIERKSIFTIAWLYITLQKESNTPAGCGSAIHFYEVHAHVLRSLRFLKRGSYSGLVKRKRKEKRQFSSNAWYEYLEMIWRNHLRRLRYIAIKKQLSSCKSKLRMLRTHQLYIVICYVIIEFIKRSRIQLVGDLSDSS